MPVMTQLLFNATKKLHGYSLHNRLANYLNSLAWDADRLGATGLGPDARSAVGGDDITTFDGGALHLEQLCDVIVAYLHVHLGHKKANHWLVNDDTTPRVLHLRGFEYQTSYGAGGAAVGVSTAATTTFTGELTQHLQPDLRMYKTLSPEDLGYETLGGYDLFDQDAGLREFMGAVPLSFYLNADHWQDDVARIVDQMDHFVVYVSSITDSVLWELDLLRRTQRADHTTVVFDERAITGKASFSANEQRLGAMHRDGTLWPGRVLWPGRTDRAGTISAMELRDALGQSFPVVMPPEEFFATIDTQKRRIAQSAVPVGSSARKAMVDFRFHPAISPDALAELRALDRKLDSVIRQAVTSRQITNLPWFFNQVQLRILTSLMLGDHKGAGSALSVYALVLPAVAVRVRGDEQHAGLTDAQFARFDRLISQHFHAASEGSRALLTVGSADGHGDFSYQLRLQDGVLPDERAAASFVSAVCRPDRSIRVLAIPESDQRPSVTSSAQDRDSAVQAIIRAVKGGYF
jgi:hypothetical protein